MSIINISQQEKLKEKAKEYNEKNEKKGKIIF